MVSLAGAAAVAAGAAAAGASTDGFSGGRGAAACFVSAGLNAFGNGLASALGFAAGAAAGVVEAVVSAVAPPMPTLRARLEKKPSDCWLCAGAAEATRVFCALGAGARLVIVNREPTEQDEVADLVVHDEIGPLMSSVVPAS